MQNRTNEQLDELGKIIVDTAVRIHRSVGPGLLESAYQKILIHELTLRGLKVERELPVPLNYHGRVIDLGYRLDILVEDSVIIENKAVEDLMPIHKAQLLTYMKLRDCKLGYLLNWNVVRMKHGIRRVVLNF